MTENNPMTTENKAEKRLPGWRILAHNPVTVAAVIVLLAVLVAALAGPSIAPYGINATDISRALQPPSAQHWFGTDWRVALLGTASPSSWYSCSV
jgi:ABC-type dipeptide/oligopeptide/nickel transport system permease subunit